MRIKKNNSFSLVEVLMAIIAFPLAVVVEKPLNDFVAGKMEQKNKFNNINEVKK